MRSCYRMTGAAAERNPEEEDELIVATPLDDFLDNLIAAGEILDKGVNGGRLGAMEALNAVWTFLNTIPGTTNHRRPIVALLNALVSLDDGVTLPMLKQKAGGPGRRPTSAAHNCSKAIVTAAAERLQSVGMAQDEAYRGVAKTCNQAGFAPGRGRNPTVTAQTVRCWHEVIEADFERKSDAAKTLDQLRQSWATVRNAHAGNISATSLQRDLLKALRQTLAQIRAG
jgi:hypothetical protein